MIFRRIGVVPQAPQLFERHSEGLEDVAELVHEGVAGRAERRHRVDKLLQPEHESRDPRFRRAEVRVLLDLELVHKRPTASRDLLSSSPRSALTLTRPT